MNTSGGANLAEKRATQSSRTNSVRRIQAEPRETKSHLPPGHLNLPLRDLQTEQKKIEKRGTSVAVKAQESGTLLRLRRHFPAAPPADLSPTNTYRDNETTSSVFQPGEKGYLHHSAARNGDHNDMFAIIPCYFKDHTC
ncbi:hypothetical protein GW17_00056011 [Ensete ventricosum]|nr:hypothetical protein GW17_00056011 [Ensete ventricosum]